MRDDAAIYHEAYERHLTFCKPCKTAMCGTAKGWWDLWQAALTRRYVRLNRL